MNEADIPIDIHTLKLQDWLVSRRIVPKNIQASLKSIRSKIQNALKDMPSHEKLIKLLTGTNINYYHCKEIVEILKQTEKDTKSVFGTYGSQRMRDWQEIVRLYENNAIYLAETSQIFVRNVNYEIPNMKKQMSKLEQQSEECLKRVGDLGKPEVQLLSDHANLLQELGVRNTNNNLRQEFVNALSALPELYTKSIANIAKIQPAIDLYAEYASAQAHQQPHQIFPVLRHLVEFGNTTVYQYIHKEEPLRIEEPELKLTLQDDNLENANDNEIDFGGTDENGASSTVSGEIIDFGDCNMDDAGDIDWGIESTSNEAVEINFDIPVEEYGIVVEGAGMDGGLAKGEQAYTLLDSTNYRDRFLDEIYELEAFLHMRLYELHEAVASKNFMHSVMDNVSSHDSSSISNMQQQVELIIQHNSSEQLRHLFQLKHSPKYADLLASKLKQMTKAVEKIRTTKEVLKERSVELKQQRQDLNPVIAELISQTKQLQLYIEKDISKRYKNRIVNLLGVTN